MATIQAMAEEGTLPTDKTMEKVFTECQAIAQMEDDFT